MAHHGKLQPPTEGELWDPFDGKLPQGKVLIKDRIADSMGWREAGELIERALERTIEQKRVTYDFHRQMEGATKLSCSGFGDAIIENIQNV